MADADIRVNEGTGPKVDMRTVGAGTDENRQVVVIGDPSAATGVAPVDPTYGMGVDVKKLPASSFGDPTDGAASGNGSLIAIIKYLRLQLTTGIAVSGIAIGPGASPNGLPVISGNGQSQAFGSAGRYASAILELSGTWVGTLIFEGSVDGTNYFTIPAHNGTTIVTGTTANGQFLVHCGPLYAVRVRSTAWTSGSVTIWVQLSYPPHPAPTYPLPPGTNNIGDVDVLTMPADPLGANSDAAVHDATGSINAHLRGIAKGLGTNADAVVAAGAAGSIDALLRAISRDIVANIVLAAGTNAIGKLAANSGVDIGDVDVTSIAAGSNLIGDVGLQPRTTGGLTPYKLVSAATTNAQSVKTSAGQVYTVNVTNNAVGWRYLKFYNKASAPTVGSDTVVYVIGIPPGGGHAINFPQGLAFATGIAISVVTGIADTDATATGANEVVVSLGYK